MTAIHTEHDVLLRDPIVQWAVENIDTTEKSFTNLLIQGKISQRTYRSKDNWALMCQWESCWAAATIMLSFIVTILSPVKGERSINVRGHSRNQPMGGRNSPQRYDAVRFSDHFSQSGSLFKDLYHYLLYFVQNFVLIIAFYRFEDKK